MSSVSVVTVTKEDPVGIARTLKSIAEQKRIPDQVIIVSDEPDESATIQEVRATRLPHLVELKDLGKGPYHAMNMGLARVRSDYVVFLNGGDSFASPDALGALVDTCVEGNFAWGYGGVRIMDEAARSRLYLPRRVRWRLLAFGLQYVPHPSAIVAVGELRSVGGFRTDVGPVADQLVFIALARRSKPARLLRSTSVFWLGGISTRSPRQVSSDLRAMRRAAGIQVLPFNGLDRVTDELVVFLRTVGRSCRSSVARLKAHQLCLGRQSGNSSSYVIKGAHGNYTTTIEIDYGVSGADSR